MPADSSILPNLSSLRREAKSLLDQFRPQPARCAGPGPANTIQTRRIFATDRDALMVVARKYGHPGWWELQGAFEEEAGGWRNPRGAGGPVRRARLPDVSRRRPHQSARTAPPACWPKPPGSPRRAPGPPRAAFDVEALRLLTRAAETAAAPGGPPRLAASPLPLLQPSTGGQAAARRPWLPRSSCSAPTPPATPRVGPEERGGWRLVGPDRGPGGRGAPAFFNSRPTHGPASSPGILLDAGADPNDSQGLYNTMFTPDNQWLELFLSRGLAAAAVGLSRPRAAAEDPRLPVVLRGQERVGGTGFSAAGARRRRWLTGPLQRPLELRERRSRGLSGDRGNAGPIRR